MSKKQERRLLAGLDIGTSKVAAIIGEVNEEGKIEIIGVGSHPSMGLKRGVVINIDATVHAISRAVEDAELMAGCEVHSVYTGISGSHVKSFNSHGIVAVKDHEVMQADLDSVIDAAKAVAIPADQRILHIIPQEFIIDEQAGIREPLGMSGVRLEAKVHMVTGAVSAAQNIIKCIERCGLTVQDIILQPLASSQSVLSEDEKELGVCMVDIGGGTADIAVFTNGMIRHSTVLPVGGDHVTNDIAVALRTPMQAAETIKREKSCVKQGLDDPEALVDIPGVGDRPGRQVAKRVLADVVSARYEELFELVRKELTRAGFQDLIRSGVVLTGGGSCVKGGVSLAESVFKMPVRLGVPKNVIGFSDVVENPTFATGLGLLQYAQLQQEENRGSMFVKQGVQGLFGKMRQWFQTSW